MSQRLHNNEMKRVGKGKVLSRNYTLHKTTTARLPPPLLSMFSLSTEPLMEASCLVYAFI